jgi:hypothetical protein
MSRRIRNVLTAIVLVGFTALTLASAWSAVVNTNAPAEHLERDRAALRQWLTTADPEHDPLKVKRHWVHRLEQDFRSGYDWQGVYNELPAAEQQRFAANFETLTRVMLLDKVDAWATRSRRPELYLEEELPDLQNWKLIGNNDPDAKKARSVVKEIARNPDRWFADVAPRTRKRVDDFRKALEKLTWSRELYRWLPRP